MTPAVFFGNMRRIALQSAIGGIVLSVGGMMLAAFGLLTPVWGAIAQEIIDVFAVANSLRASFKPRKISDFESDESNLRFYKEQI